MPNDVVAKSSAKGKPDKPKPVKVERKGDPITKKIARFIRESYVEVVKKAAWLTWPELKKFTAVVILAVLIVGVWIGGLDYCLGALIPKIERIFRPVAQ